MATHVNVSILNHCRIFILAFLVLHICSFMSVAQSDIVELHADDLRQHTDQTVQEALLRMHGTGTNYDGILNLRALGANRYNVTVDGQRLATSGFGVRGLDLDMLSNDMFRSIQWIRFQRADMDANALAGTINLRTDVGLATERSITARVGAGSNPDYYRLTGTISNASLQYTEPLLESLSLHLNLAVQQDITGWEGFTSQYAVRDFGDGPEDVLQRLSPSVETVGTQRAGGNLQLTFRPDERQQYHIRVLANVSEQEFIRHQSQWFANNSWVNPTTTGNLGRHFYNLDTHVRSTQLYAVQAGGQNQLNIIRLSYNLGWAHTYTEQSRYGFGFEALNMPHTVNMDDRNRPTAEPVNNMPTRQTMRLMPMNYITDRHLDTRVSGRLDGDVDLGVIALRVGFSLESGHKDANDAGAFAHIIYNSRVLQTLNDFDEMRVRNFSVLNNAYTIPWLSDAASARNFVDSSVPAFATNEQVNRLLTEMHNYGAFEDVYAAYALTEAEFGNLSIYAGIRMEHTEARYEGRAVRFDRFNRFQSTTELGEGISYTNVLPSARFAFQLTEGVQLSTALSTTLHRHDYQVLAPFQMVSGSDTTIFSGNSSLKPIKSNNIDFHADATLSASTRFRASAFYKNVRDYIEVQQRSETFIEGQEQVFDYIFENNVSLSSIQATISQYQNSEATAAIYGFDFGLDQRMLMLPGVLRHLGVSATYTYTISELENVRENSVILQDYSPHYFQTSIDFTTPRGFLQLSYQWASEVLTIMQDAPRLAPSVSSTEPVFFDQYTEGWSDLSFSAGVAFSSRVNVWVNAYNLLGAEQRVYHEDRNLYPSGSMKRIGRGVMAGIQFNL